MASTLILRAASHRPEPAEDKRSSCAKGLRINTREQAKLKIEGLDGLVNFEGESGAELKMPFTNLSMIILNTAKKRVHNLIKVNQVLSM